MPDSPAAAATVTPARSAAPSGKRTWTIQSRGRQELFDRDGGFADGGELVTVASGDEAGEEERAALLAYNRYLHRYDKEWLEKHPRQEPQSPAR